MKICIMGAGVGGLTTAHKLVKEGHEVHIYDRNPEVGGQARSSFTKDGEHSEYCMHYITNTCNGLLTLLREIPFKDGTVFDNLKRIRQFGFGFRNGHYVIEGEHPISSSSSKNLDIASKMKVKITTRDMVKMAAFHLFVRTSSQMRFKKYDDVYWKDLMGSLSPAIKQIAVDYISLQFGVDPMKFNVRTVLECCRPPVPVIDRDSLDCLHYYRFNGSFSERWFNPWAEYLKSMGISIHLNTNIKHICCEGGEIKEIIVEDLQGGEQHLQYDYYVNSMDVQGFSQALSGVDELKKRMQKLTQLSSQFQLQVTVSLKEKILYSEPTIIYLPDTPWNIMIACESSFWDFPLSKREPPPGEVLAMVLGVFHNKGILYDKTPQECTEEELMCEMWAQMKECTGILSQYKTSDGRTLNDVRYISYNIWYSFGYNQENGIIETYEPKYSNNVGTMALLPPTHQEDISNLVHATVYTQNDMIFATMEGASESGTRAANFIKNGQRKVDTVKVYHPGWFWGACQYFDNILARIGLPNLFEVLLNWI